MIQAAEADKTFLLGTHRVVSPETTLTRVLPFARRMGVTRLAVLTGLDVLGIPTVAAIRPNSRSVAQHQGKGVTLAAAKASALMEAAEAFHAEHFSGPLLLATFAEISAIGPATDPARLPGANGPIGERILWVQGRDLANGGPLWAPHELVTTDYTEPQLETRFQGTSNGLASGNNRLEAVLHGIYEVIERDANALFQQSGDAAQDACAVDLDSIDGPCADLLDAFRRADVRLRVWDQTSDIGLPVFGCMSASVDDADAVEPDMGFGCHADRDIALSRALTEVAQCRLTRIAGARDDIDPASYDASARQRARSTARRWMATTPQRSFGAAPTRSRASLNDDLEHALARLDAVGCGQVSHVDLTRPEFGIAVARVIVPGLEGVWLRPDQGYVPGERARRVAP